MSFVLNELYEVTAKSRRSPGWTSDTAIEWLSPEPVLVPEVLAWPTNTGKDGSVIACFDPSSLATSAGAAASRTSSAESASFTLGAATSASGVVKPPRSVKREHAALVAITIEIATLER